MSITGDNIPRDFIAATRRVNSVECSQSTARGIITEKLRVSQFVKQNEFPQEENIIRNPWKVESNKLFRIIIRNEETSRKSCH